MGYSSLVDLIHLSPNSMGRGSKIDTITIHCMAVDQSIEACLAYLSMRSAKASANYVIGSDGRVGLCVDESRRSQASDNWQNDDRAITIEVANDTGYPEFHVSDKAMEKLIALCIDICQRNGIERLNFTGDTTGNMTMHKWFKPGKTCPGEYLESKFPYIAERVNMVLLAGKESDEKKSLPQITSKGVKHNDERTKATSACVFRVLQD